MSGSPKYSFAQLGQQLRDRLQRDRDTRRKRREDTEKQTRRTALSGERAGLLSRRDALRAALAALAGQAPPASLSTTTVTLDQAEALATTAGTLDEITAAGAALDRAERSIGRLRTRIAERSRQTSADRIAVLKAAIEDFGRADRVRYDPAGTTDIDVRLRDTATADLDDLTDRVQRHLDRAAAGRADHQSRRRLAAARVEQLDARLADLRQDGRAAHVTLPEADRAAEAVGLLRTQLAAGQVDDVVRLSAGLERRIDGIERRIDAVVDELAERRAILTSLVRALPEVGFSVDPGSLTESSDGAIGLRAVRSSGETVAVIVEPDTDDSHRVLYTSDVLQREQRLGRGDAACASLLDLINLLQRSAGQDGVVLSTVGWEGGGQARRLPVPPPGASRARESRPW
jgi:chromosome segregation ATPase